VLAIGRSLVDLLDGRITGSGPGAPPASTPPSPRGNAPAAGRTPPPATKVADAWSFIVGAWSGTLPDGETVTLTLDATLRDGAHMSLARRRMSAFIAARITNSAQVLTYEPGMDVQIRFEGRVSPDRQTIEGQLAVPGEAAQRVVLSRRPPGTRQPPSISIPPGTAAAEPASVIAPAAPASPPAGGPIPAPAPAPPVKEPTAPAPRPAPATIPDREPEGIGPIKGAWAIRPVGQPAARAVTLTFAGAYVGNDRSPMFVVRFPGGDDNAGTFNILTGEGQFAFLGKTGGRTIGWKSAKFVLASGVLRLTVEGPGADPNPLPNGQFEGRRP
jgi:hypothetical protein